LANCEWLIVVLFLSQENTTRSAIAPASKSQADRTYCLQSQLLFANIINNGKRVHI